MLPRLSNHARQAFHGSAGRVGQKGFSKEQIAALVGSEKYATAAYIAYRAVAVAYVHLFCMAVAHFFRWWWWLEASGIEALIANPIVVKAGQVLPGPLG